MEYIQFDTYWLMSQADKDFLAFFFLISTFSSCCFTQHNKTSGGPLCNCSVVGAIFRWRWWGVRQDRNIPLCVWNPHCWQQSGSGLNTCRWCNLSVVFKAEAQFLQSSFVSISMDRILLREVSLKSMFRLKKKKKKMAFICFQVWKG